MSATLREIAHVRQDHDSLRRRWWSSERMDIYVWQDAEAQLHAFEICYGKPRNEHSLRWTDERGMAHARVDDGEATPFEQGSPIAIADAEFSLACATARFEADAATLEPRVYRQILSRLYRGAAPDRTP